MNKQNKTRKAKYTKHPDVSHVFGRRSLISHIRSNYSKDSEFIIFELKKEREETK